MVLDASAAVLGLLNDGEARARMVFEPLSIPHLADAEVAQALRNQCSRKAVSEAEAERALERWSRLGLRRHGALGLLSRVWQLRENLSAYDATYVALAEAIGCELLTADARLAAAPGVQCPVLVVPG